MIAHPYLRRWPQVEEQPRGSSILWLAPCPNTQGLAIPQRRSTSEAMLSSQPIGHQHVLLKAIYSEDLPTSCRMRQSASTTRSSETSAARVSSLDFFLSSFKSIFLPKRGPDR